MCNHNKAHYNILLARIICPICGPLGVYTPKHWDGRFSPDVDQRPWARRAV